MEDDLFYDSVYYEIPDLSEIDETNVQYKLEELEDEKRKLEQEISAIIRSENSLNAPNLANAITVLQARAKQCSQDTDSIVDEFSQHKRNADKLNETFERVQTLHSNLQSASQELATLSSIESITNRLNEARGRMDSGSLNEASELLDVAEKQISANEDAFKQESGGSELKVLVELRGNAKRLFADLVCEISESYRDAITSSVSQAEQSVNGSAGSARNTSANTISRIRFAKQSHRVPIGEVLRCVVRWRDRAPHLFGRLNDLFDAIFSNFIEPLVCDPEVQGESPLALVDSTDSFVVELRHRSDSTSSASQRAQTESAQSASSKNKLDEPAGSDWDVELVDPELADDNEAQVDSDNEESAFATRLESAKRRLDSVRRFLTFVKSVVEDTVFKELVTRIESRLSDTLIEHVLKSTLPTCAAQLTRVGGLRELVTDFCDELARLGFFKDKDVSAERGENALIRYVSNVCAVFVEKKALVALDRARKLVRDASLFETLPVPADFDRQFAIVLRSSQTHSGDSASLTNRFVSLLHDYMADSGSADRQHEIETVTEQFGTFVNAQAQFDDGLSLKLPQCKVSSFTHELVELIRQSIEEAFQLAASANRDESSMEVQFTAAERVCLVDGVYEATRNVFDTFAVLVASASVASPQFDELPQSGAIQYCNAHYLAHYAALFQLYFALLATGSSDCAASAFDCYTFLDVQTRLRQLGIECLAHHMRVQRAVLVDQILDSLNFASLEDAPMPVAGKAKASREPGFTESGRVFRQCTLQLDSLGRVWRDVLPTNIFRRCMAALVNECFRFLFDKVAALEDIGEYEASFLNDSLLSLQKHAAQLIRVGTDEPQELTSAKRPTRTDTDKLNELEASRVISKWLAIDELRFVLNATMVEIDERWCDAQGPLAQVFDATQLRGLVRALFENNERRATLLSKIK